MSDIDSPVDPNETLADEIFQDKEIVAKTIDQITLNELEKLKFTNIQLQKNILALQQKELDRQEGELLSSIKKRSGVDIEGWGINLETGICTPRSDNGLQ